MRGPLPGVILAVITIYFGFNAGGFFPGTVATVVIGLCFLLVLGVMLVSRPYESFTPALLVPLALLAAFAAMTLLSAVWSNADGRALFEFDRALLYVLTFAFFGMLVPGKRRLEWGLLGFLVAAFVICGAGWITRVAPDLWPIATDVRPERLSFPLTYWNALGLMSSLGLVACLHFAAGERQAKGLRIAAAAAAPLIASTLLFTFSRASLGLLPVGVIVYVLLARPRRLLPALVAIGPPVAVAMVVSYRAEIVSTARYTSAAGQSQGHHVALVVIACMIGAAVLRALLLRWDARLEAWQPPRVERRTLWAWIGGAIALIVVVALVAGAPHWINSQYENFVHGDVVGHLSNPRERLASTGNNGRIAQWEVALEAFSQHPIIGRGSGTYELSWAQHRPYPFTVINAHSLYLEVMGELGVIGALLIVGALVSIFVGLARRMRGEDRHVYAAVIALAVVWAIHAGIDWDWQMPAVTLWLFALAGLGLSRPVRATARATARAVPGRMVRIVAAVCVAVLAVTPAAIALSQSHLETALTQFDANECDAAINSSLDSLDDLKVRPEPYEVIGYCDARIGQSKLAELAMENAISRDPDSWEPRYGLAIVQAAAGRDPMPALEAAKHLNPLEPLILEEVEAFKGVGPKEWERRANLARLPF
jgi:O-antigen ligase